MTDWLDGDTIYAATGVVVPAFFSASTNEETVARLLRMTLADLPRIVAPENVWLVVDGDPRTAEIARGVLPCIAPELQLLSLPSNQGKLGAMREGTLALLATRPQVRYVAFLDGDGDHMATVVPRLVRTVAYIEGARGIEDVVVIGARASRSRPMGWLRGELEELLDQVTVDALAYALARQGRVLDVSCFLPGQVCDISSGFKVFTRHLVANTVARAPGFLGTISRADYDRYGPETMTVVEAALAGALVAEAQRPTWDGQPTTAYGEYRLVAVYGELLAWVWERLDISVEGAAAMFDNRAPARALRTTQEGVKLLAEVRTHALTRLQAWRGEEGAIAPPRALPPFF